MPAEVKSTAQHTPGPWEARLRTETPRSSGLSVFAPSGASVCDITYYVNQPVYFDARLIAAAPDLKNACDALLHAFKLGDNDLLKVAGTLADLAVAKAEGR